MRRATASNELTRTDSLGVRTGGYAAVSRILCLLAECECRLMRVCRRDQSRWQAWIGAVSKRKRTSQDSIVKPELTKQSVQCMGIREIGTIFCIASTRLLYTYPSMYLSCYLSFRLSSCVDPASSDAIILLPFFFTRMIKENKYKE